MWCRSEGREILTELSLCYSSVYHCNGAQWYEQFLPVGHFAHALFNSVLRSHLYFRSSWYYILLYILRNFLLYSLLYQGRCDWPLTWCYNSVRWVIVPKTTYNVSSGTLNPATLYRALDIALVSTIWSGLYSVLCYDMPLFGGHGSPSQRSWSCTTRASYQYSCMVRTAGRYLRPMHARSMHSTSGVCVCCLASNGTNLYGMMMYGG